MGRGVIWHRMLVIYGGKNVCDCVSLVNFHFMFCYILSQPIVIRQLPVPVIAVLHGMCFGGGKCPLSPCVLFKLYLSARIFKGL